jgi:hypothetical protein
MEASQSASSLAEGREHDLRASFRSNQDRWQHEQEYLGAVREKAATFSLEEAGGSADSVSWVIAAFDSLAGGRRLLACTSAWQCMHLVSLSV